ncbi:MAG: lmo0937 family membrane protein, partial [Patescibacteria group bacterium]|nr:lmo0937 family membrane protein [Patescibacteria group bacterium]
ILVILWAVGFIGFHVISWFIQLLLVAAIILVLIRIIQGRNPI